MTTVTFNIEYAELPLLEQLLKKFGAKNINIKDEKTSFEFLGDLNDEGMEEFKTATEEMIKGDFVTHEEVTSNVTKLWK